MTLFEVVAEHDGLAEDVGPLLRGQEGEPLGGALDEELLREEQSLGHVVSYTPAPELDVGDHEVVVVALTQRDRVGGVPCDVDPASQQPEQPGEGGADELLIIDDEHEGLGGGAVFGGRPVRRRSLHMGVNQARRRQVDTKEEKASGAGPSYPREARWMDRSM